MRRLFLAARTRQVGAGKGEVGDIAKDSNNVEYPTTALVSIDLMNLFERTRMPDSGDTLLSFILRTQREKSTLVSGGIRDIIGLVECGSATLEAKGVHSGGNNKDRILLYDRDPEILEKHMMSGAINLFPEDWVMNKGARRIYPMYACMSQTIVNFPGGLRYLDHPKSA